LLGTGVYIPKNDHEKRPLGLLELEDICGQTYRCLRVLKIFIRNWALLAHIHLHLMGASFTELKQGPFYWK
jgi:hypothetical protein